jgi:hypothetical protein
MNFGLRPRQRLFVILAGRLNREQQAVVEYLRTENQILKEITHIWITFNDQLIL